MNVMRLLHGAVFVKAGSYVISPKSSAAGLDLAQVEGLMVPSSIGTS